MGWGLRKGVDYRVLKAETTISLVTQVARHYNLASLLLSPDGTVDPTVPWAVFLLVLASFPRSDCPANGVPTPGVLQLLTASRLRFLQIFIPVKPKICPCMSLFHVGL